MNFVEKYPIDKITPADYNPRKINEDAFEKLKESLKKFGVVKAVISNKDGTIVAGHQRTKAMKAIGITEVPVFILQKNVALQDEIRFNLMHNSVETETSKTVIKNADALPFGFSMVSPSDVDILQKGLGSYIKEICNLLNRYGEYGSIVIDEYGVVIHNSDYAYCSKLLAKEIVVYKMRNDVVKEFCDYMKIDYGTYNYETLGIKPYVQTYCQMNRSDTNMRSTTYERYVLPNLRKDMRLCDFGAGKLYYVNMLKQQGFKAFGYEPFYRTPGTNNLNISEVIRFINEICADIAKNGLYDVVVLDSVINSITSEDYQDWVLTCCNALLGKDGTFYTGTRNKGQSEAKVRMTKCTGRNRSIEFLDKDDFSATFRNGVWTLQKFHTKETLKALLENYFQNVTVYGTETGSQIWAVCKKPLDLGKEKYKTALDIEFNLEYPGAVHHNQHEKIVNAILGCH